jgi:hypothetical protein
MVGEAGSLADAVIKVWCVSPTNDSRLVYDLLICEIEQRSACESKPDIERRPYHKSIKVYLCVASLE